MKLSSKEGFILFVCSEGVRKKQQQPGDGWIALILVRGKSDGPLQVIRDGQLLRRNMRREFLTEEELMHHLRKQGIEEVKDVKAAHVEEYGSMTVTSDRGNK